MIADTLYAKYIKEREGLDILENDHAFLTYKINDKECYLANFYVDHDRRKRGSGRALLAELGRVARDFDCEVITANIWMWDQGASKTVRAALACGFVISRAADGVLLISMNLKGGDNG